MIIFIIRTLTPISALNITANAGAYVVWHETDGGNDDTRSDSSVKAMFFVKGFGDRTVF